MRFASVYDYHYCYCWECCVYLNRLTSALCGRDAAKKKRTIGLHSLLVLNMPWNMSS